MNVWKLLILALALALSLVMAGCGGGGGGGSSPPPGGGGPPPGGEPPPTEPPPEPPPAGSAAISFPWKNSGATDASVVVRGTASSADGVAQVLVNGLPATIASASGFVLADAHSPSEVEWSIEVDLATGTNELAVSVVDVQGETTHEADVAQVSYLEVPVYFTLDAPNSRVVGVSYALTPGGYSPRLVEHDYLTGEQKVLPFVWIHPALSCLRAQANEYLYLIRWTDDSWVLRRVDLDSGQDSLAVPMPSNAFAPIDASYLAGDPWQLVCGPDEAYVSVRNIKEDTFQLGKSRILRIGLNSQQVSLLTESSDAESPPWTAWDMALTDNSIVSVQDPVDPVAPLSHISLASGTRTPLTGGLNVAGGAIALDLPNGRVYVATLDGVDVVNVIAPASIDPLPGVDDLSPFTFSQVVGASFDAANNRVLVADTDLEAIIAVDATTGERSKFLSTSIGHGAPMITGRRLALTSNAERAYVADDGGNGPERLFEVDLSNGDRRVIGNVNHPFNVFLTGLTLDEEGERAFVSSPDRIVEVDLVSGSSRTVATTGSSDVLQSISSLLFDPGTNRLLAADNAIDAIVAVNLANFQQTIVSQEGTRGAGEGFQAINSLTFGDAAASVYVTNQTSDKVMRVDLVSGDRQTVATGCVPGHPPDEFGNDNHLWQVVYNAPQDELLVLGDRLFSYKLDSTECIEIPLRLLPMAIQVTERNQLLAVGFEGMTQIDRHTGDVVVVSK